MCGPDARGHECGEKAAVGPDEACNGRPLIPARFPGDACVQFLAYCGGEGEPVGTPPANRPLHERSDRTAQAADEPGRPTPSAVIVARSAARLLDGFNTLLHSAGAPERAVRIRAFLEALNGLNGIDHHRPLGILLYLSEVEGKDPDYLLFFPVISMEELRRSLDGAGRIALAARDEPDWWELRAGETTIPIRVRNGSAFAALRRELLSGPLPDVEEWTTPLLSYDVALSIHAEGIPPSLLERAVESVHRDAERDRERRPEESAIAHELRSRVSHGVEWLLERTLRDLERLTAGVRLSREGQGVECELRLAAAPASPLAELLTGSAGTPSQFVPQYDPQAALAVSFAWNLPDEARRLAASAAGHLRRQIERSMRQDGSHDGPAAAPIATILDALDATVNDGRLDGLILFHGERPGGMSLLTAWRLARAPDVDQALSTILPLIAQTPAVSEIEMHAVRAEALALHRVTPAEVRPQDQWLYGPQASLYLGAGRDALWLALGEPRAAGTLHRLVGSDAQTPSAPALLRVDLRFARWLHGESGRSQNEARWIDHARQAFAGGGDRLHLELTAGPAELRLQGTVEEGYIRLLGALWRARRSATSDVPPSTLSSPVQRSP